MSPTGLVPALPQVTRARPSRGALTCCRLVLRRRRRRRQDLIARIQRRKAELRLARVWKRAHVVHYEVAPEYGVPEYDAVAWMQRVGFRV